MKWVKNKFACAALPAAIFGVVFTSNAHADRQAERHAKLLNSAYCEAPDMTAQATAQLYLWKNCDSGPNPNPQRTVWNVKAVGGTTGGAVRFDGDISSDYSIKNSAAVLGSNVAFNAQIEPSTDYVSYEVGTYSKTVKFTLQVGAGDSDSFSISIHNDAAAVGSLENLLAYNTQGQQINSVRSILIGEKNIRYKLKSAGLDNSDPTFLSFADYPIQNFDKYEEWGMLSVTESIDGQDGAIPDDQFIENVHSNDDTAAIQRTINKAIEDGSAVYFPPGEYIISDTLSAMIPATNNNGKIQQADRRKPATFIGSTVAAKRPLLKLNPRSGAGNSFNQLDSPKPLVWIWAQCVVTGNVNSEVVPSGQCNAGWPYSVDPAVINLNDDELLIPENWQPKYEQSNIAFAQVFRGIDIDLTSNQFNQGAVGLRMASSQGSTLQDVNINATDAYAGVINPPGQGGGTYNVNVTGGRYGIEIEDAARYPVMAGVTFKGQTEAAIYTNGLFPLVVTGFGAKLEPSTSLVLVGTAHEDLSFANTVTLADGVVDANFGALSALVSFKRNEAVNNNDFVRKSVVIKNVELKAYRSQLALLADSEEQGGMVTLTSQAEKSGALVENVRLLSSNESNSESVYDEESTLTTIETASVVPFLYDTEFLYNSSTLPNDYDIDQRIENAVRKHVWDKFVSFEDDDVYIAQLLDNNYSPQDMKNELQETIDGQNISDKIFLPKGTYTISSSIRLGAHTKLIGAGKYYTRLKTVADEWPDNRPMITTVNDHTATTTLASIFLENDISNTNPAFVKWQAGKDSYFKDVFFGQDFVNGVKYGDSYGNISIGEMQVSLPANNRLIHIFENGGGKWYSVAGEWNRLKPYSYQTNSLGVLVHNKNNSPYTDNPLYMYGVNIERVLSDKHQMSIVNSDDVHIVYLKGETQRIVDKVDMNDNLVLDSDGIPIRVTSSDTGPAVLNVYNSNNISVLGFSGNAVTNEAKGFANLFGQISVYDNANSQHNMFFSSLCGSRPNNQHLSFRYGSPIAENISIDGAKCANLIKLGNTSF